MPEEALIISPKLDTSDQKLLFSALSEHIRYCNAHALSTGHPYGAMLPTDRLGNDSADIYSHFFTKISAPPADPSHPLFRKPAGMYAVTYLKGDYYASREAYQKLLTFIQERHRTPGPYCYKEAVWDELTVQQPDEYITKISIPML